jgi:hypothetical protein
MSAARWSRVKFQSKGSAISFSQPLCLAGYLVAQHQRQLQLRKATIDDVQIAATHSRTAHPHHHFLSAWARIEALLYHQPLTELPQQSRAHTAKLALDVAAKPRGGPHRPRACHASGVTK